jgi:hypothetical protein
LALAAVAAAGTWIYNNWDGIRAMFQGIGEGIRSAFEPAAPIFDALSASFETLFGWLGDLLGPIDATEAEWRDFGVNIGEWIGGAITSLIDMFNGFVEWLTGLPSMIIDAIGSISLSDIIQWPEPPDWWTALMGGLEPSETVSGAIGRGSMRRSRGSGPSIDGARASGGPVRAGGTYLVGEEGPELVTFGQSGFVHNTRATTNALSGARDAVSPGGAGGITLPDPNALTPQGIGATQGTPQTSAGDGVAVSITGPLTGPITITNGQNPMDFVDQIGERLEAELARRLRGLYADGI